MSGQSCIPFVEYVLRSMELPPNMFVSKLAACCTILFLTRSDPERLKELSHRWALRFAMDRRRLLHSIAKRWRIEPPLDLASSSSTESEGGTTVSAESTGATAESEKPSTTQKRVSGDGHITTPLSSTLYTSVELPLCSEDASVGHFFNVLNSLVPSYFSFNWHRMDYIIQINREYESFVRESLMPICLGINPLEGEDDPDTRLWLIPPSEYMNPPASLPRTLSTSSCTNNNTNGELSLHPWRPTLLPASNNNKSMLMESEEQRSSNNVSPTSSSSVRGLPGFMNTPVSGGPSANFPRSTTAMMMMMRRATSDMVISPNMSSPTSTDFSSFDFLTVTNFRAALFHNQRGLVLLFHAKYSPKSSIVCNILKEIIARKRLDPMPTVAVIYAVAEPELAGLYNIRWMPTIVFVPPCSSERVMEETSENSQGSSTHDLPQPNGQTAQPSQTWSGEGGGEELEMAATHCPMLCAAEHDTSTRCTSTSNNNISASASTSITTVAARATTSSFSDANHFSTTRYGYTHVLPFHTGATSSTSAPNNNNNNSTSTNNLCTSPRTAEVAAVVAHSPTARLYGFSAEHIHSLSQSSMRMATPLASSSLASSSEELRTLIAKDEHCVYPNAAPSTVEAIESWIASKGLVEPPVRSAKELLTDIHSIREGQKFQQARELRSAVVTLRRLQEDEGSNSSCGASSPNTMGAGRDLNAITSNSTPPMFVFLGGGMAAGKSTATAGLATSAWWQPCKQGSVLVNADEFKLITPNNTSEVPSWMQHDNSTRAAETMLINAVNQGRSVVFDGTMMWAPFVVQVIEMVRRAHTTLHARGRGYCGPGREEVYFVPQRPRMKPLPHPYKIVLLGITVDVETAVPRGFLRTFSTGRGVPIGVQIRSFKLFAENFERYASLVDAVTLYNNNVFVDLNRGELPPVIVERSDATGGEFVVHDHDAFQSFQRQRLLREDADNVFELYPPTSPSQQAEPTSTLVGAATTT